MTNFFEQPWAMLGVAVVVFIAMWVFRAVSPQRRHWWQFALPVFLGLAAFGLDYFVQTDTEKITSLLTNMSKAVEQENPGAIEPLISPDYRDSVHVTKMFLMVHCKARLSEPFADKVVTRIVSLDIQPQNATVVFTSRILFDKESSAAGFTRLMLAKAKMKLQKNSANQWLIQQIEIIELNRQKANWKDVPR